jgi:hypothetical protein
VVPEERTGAPSREIMTLICLKSEKKSKDHFILHEWEMDLKIETNDI